jgi:hypothetical protein
LRKLGGNIGCIEGERTVVVVEKAEDSGGCGEGRGQWCLWRRQRTVVVLEKAENSGGDGEGR